MVTIRKIPVDMEYQPKGVKHPLQLTILLNHTTVEGKDAIGYTPRQKEVFTFNDLSINSETIYLKPLLTPDEKSRLLDSILNLSIDGKPLRNQIPAVEWEEYTFRVTETLPFLNKISIIQNMLHEPFINDSDIKETGISVISVANQKDLNKLIVQADTLSLHLNPYVSKKDADLQEILNNTIFKLSDNGKDYFIPSKKNSRREIYYLLSELENVDVGVLEERMRIGLNIEHSKNYKIPTPVELMYIISSDLNASISYKVSESLLKFIKQVEPERLKVVGVEGNILKDHILANLNSQTNPLLLDFTQKLAEMPVSYRDFLISKCDLSRRISLIDMAEELENMEISRLGGDRVSNLSDRIIEINEDNRLDVSLEAEISDDLSSKNNPSIKSNVGGMDF